MRHGLTISLISHGQKEHLVIVGWVVFIASVLFCASYKRHIEHIWEGVLTNTNGWRCPGVGHGLNALQHALCVASVLEVPMDYEKVVLPSNGLEQIGRCCF